VVLAAAELERPADPPTRSLAGSGAAASARADHGNDSVPGPGPAAAASAIGASERLTQSGRRTRHGRGGFTVTY
jgi:hypothetical protein